MFHLATHAFFKALLFLGAGSVITALHHQQRYSLYGRISQKTTLVLCRLMARVFGVNRRRRARRVWLGGLLF